MRQAATEGEGFAIDEFTSDGHLNRNLLKETHMLVVKDSEGSVIAGILFGPSGACRDMNYRQVAGYMIVEKGARGKGVGNGLLTYCMENAPMLGYTSFLVDVFTPNLVMIDMMLKRGFLITATLPCCGVIVNKGRTHSLLFHRKV